MFNVIEFDKKRYTFNYEARDWNNRRIAAARRALKKEKEKAGLFPEYMRFNSVEERIEQIENSNQNRVLNYRTDAARDLWMCRKKFKALPDNVKKDVAEFWSNSLAPKEPFRLLSLIHRWEEDSLYFERRKGNASKFIQSVIGLDGKLRVVEISQEDYYAHMGNIDQNKKSVA